MFFWLGNPFYSFFNIANCTVKHTTGTNIRIEKYTRNFFVYGSSGYFMAGMFFIVVCTACYVGTVRHGVSLRGYA